MADSERRYQQIQMTQTEIIITDYLAEPIESFWSNFKQSITLHLANVTILLIYEDYKAILVVQIIE